MEIPEPNHTITKMKNSIDGFNNRIERKKEKKT